MNEKTAEEIREEIQNPELYSHADNDGMLWRFENQRPISALADIVMQKIRQEIQRDQKA